MTSCILKCTHVRRKRLQNMFNNSWEFHDEDWAYYKDYLDSPFPLPKVAVRLQLTPYVLLCLKAALRDVF